MFIHTDRTKCYHKSVSTAFYIVRYSMKHKRRIKINENQVAIRLEIFSINKWRNLHETVRNVAFNRGFLFTFVVGVATTVFVDRI